MKATDGSQPMHVAAAAGHKEVAKLLSLCCIEWALESIAWPP